MFTRVPITNTALILGQHLSSPATVCSCPTGKLSFAILQSFLYVLPNTASSAKPHPLREISLPPAPFKMESLSRKEPRLPKKILHLMPQSDKLLSEFMPEMQVPSQEKKTDIYFPPVITETVIIALDCSTYQVPGSGLVPEIFSLPSSPQHPTDEGTKDQRA